MAAVEEMEDKSIMISLVPWATSVNCIFGVAMISGW